MSDPYHTTNVGQTAIWRNGPDHPLTVQTLSPKIAQNLTRLEGSKPLKVRGMNFYMRQFEVNKPLHWFVKWLKGVAK